MVDEFAQLVIIKNFESFAEFTHFHNTIMF